MNRLIGSPSLSFAPALHSNGVHKPSRVIEAASPPHARGRDRVEVSDLARYLGKLQAMPDVRVELVAQVRQALAEGAYETQDKLELAIERLAQDI